jgi:branched-chain amino acid transport system substrate-binding protein
VTRHADHQHRTAPRLLWLISITALVLVGCGGPGATTAAGTPEPDEPPAATEAQTPASDADVPDAPDSGVTADRIVIGWMGDATGPTASAQLLNLRGSQAYVEWLNERGGLFGREVVLIDLDDGYAAEKGVQNFTRLAEDDRVLAIINIGGTHIFGAITEDIERLGVPVIGPPQTADALVDNPVVFTNLAHFGDQADVAIARMAASVGSAADVNVATVHLEIPSGLEWDAYIRATVEEAGGQYGGSIGMNPVEVDLASVALRLRALADEGVNYIAMHAAPGHAVGLMTAMNDIGLVLPIIGIQGLASPAVYEQAPAALTAVAEGIHSFIPVGVQSVGTQEIAEFVAGSGYEEEARHINFTHGWLDIMLLEEAASRAVEASGELTRASLVEALRGRFDTRGLSCPIDWTESTHSPCAAPFAWDGSGLVPVGGFADWQSEMDGIYGIAG